MGDDQGPRTGMEETPVEQHAFDGGAHAHLAGLEDDDAHRQAQVVLALDLFDEGLLRRPGRVVEMQGLDREVLFLDGELLHPRLEVHSEGS